MSKISYRNASIHPDSFDYLNLFLYEWNGWKKVESWVLRMQCCSRLAVSFRFESQRGEQHVFTSK